jgi:hypothetical protein
LLCTGLLRPCSKTPRQQKNHEIFFHCSPYSGGISITCARAAGRTSAYRTAKSAEAGSDCGAAPGIARNRPDQCTSGGSPCRALKGSGRNGLARRGGSRNRAVEAGSIAHTGYRQRRILRPGHWSRPQKPEKALNIAAFGSSQVHGTRSWAERSRS